ncbi:NicO-domain-containing protein [Pisolithus croceorrhizus]|nr:NicO-domain-containing protein [Pisolithus croceorrhizus]KAI6129632.1 NicO-domain-containing protein [Pisolithus croceorrhizus]
MDGATRLSGLFFSLTVFGRSFFLILLLLLFNAVCWGVAAGCYTLLDLSMLAWVSNSVQRLHCAIDNATRTLISRGQLPVTCGFYFSLGHSTIVIAANLAIVISTSVYNKLSAFNNLASVIGTSISASFLFIVGLANSIILWRIIRQRRVKHREGESATIDLDPSTQRTLTMRVLGPLVNFVDRPWKMYPVGGLFGLGFDTASSIALLALSALAQQDDGGNRIRPSQVLVLPLLFTGGMTLVDSLNSIMMLYSYSGFAEHSWTIFRRTIPANEVEDGDVSRDPDLDMTDTPDQTRPEWITHSARQQATSADVIAGLSVGVKDDSKNIAGEGYHVACAKRHTLSNLSILLTSMSILLAFSIAIIEIMGLIGQVCASCQRAASAADGGGLAGKWWRAWQRANDNSGYIGAAVVGVFLLVVIGWFSVKRITKTRQISLGENESLGSRMYEDNMETRGVGA